MSRHPIFKPLPLANLPCRLSLLTKVRKIVTLRSLVFSDNHYYNSCNSKGRFYLGKSFCNQLNILALCAISFDGNYFNINL